MSQDFWAFGHADDGDGPETLAPPGFTFARAIPKNAPFGKMLMCRGCGAIVAAKPVGVQDHIRFHEELALLVDNFFRPRYHPDNPKPPDPEPQPS